MGISINADICHNVCYVEINKKDKRFQWWASDDPENWSLNGWFWTGEAVECGDNGRLYGDTFQKGAFIVNVIVQHELYENSVVLCSNSKIETQEFIKDWGLKQEELILTQDAIWQRI